MGNIAMRRAAPFIGFCATLLLSTTPAFAPPPPPPPVPADITLELALQGAQAALAVCKDKHINAVVEVADRDGNSRALLAADHFYIPSYDIVRKNIYTVLTKKISSGDFEKSLDMRKLRDPQFDPGHKLGLSIGAVPVIKAGAIVGVISVSGGNTAPAFAAPYELCAIAGRDKIQAGL